jgi:4-oxalocrotonate tautomerase
MKNKVSRREFMTAGATVLGVAVACELTGAAGTGGLSVGAALASEQSREETMPHIIVKIWPGRAEETKQRLADAIARDVVDILGSSEASVSVAIEEVSSEDWKKDVYDPEIRDRQGGLYKKPGYSM